MLDNFMQSLRSALPDTWKSASWLHRYGHHRHLSLLDISHKNNVRPHRRLGQKSLTPALSKREGANL